VKRTAVSVQPMVQRKALLKKKMLELAEEYKSVDAQIQGFELGIQALCCGYGTEQLIHRVVTVVEGKLDKDGKPLKKVSYEPNGCITFDPQKNVYLLTVPDVEEQKPADGEEATAGEAGQATEPAETEVADDGKPVDTQSVAE